MPPSKAHAKLIEPMLLLHTESLSEDAAWLFELKLDGYRAVAFKTSGRVHLRSRNDKDFSTKYPAIVKALLDRHLRHDYAVRRRPHTDRYRALQTLQIRGEKDGFQHRGLRVGADDISGAGLRRLRCLVGDLAAEMSSSNPQRKSTIRRCLHHLGDAYAVLTITLTITALIHLFVITAVWMLHHSR
jgi:hypothetical protein